MILVAVQKPSETEALPAHLRVHLQSPVIMVYAPTQPQGVLSRFGNPVGALPYSVILDAGRQKCASRAGIIDESWAISAARHCQKKPPGNHT